MTKGVTAVVVYPMNALINSQFEEFMRYQEYLPKCHRQRISHFVRAIHWSGKRRCTGKDARKAPPDSPDQLYDAGTCSSLVYASEQSGMASTNNCGFWFLTNSTPTAVARGRMWRCSFGEFVLVVWNRSYVHWNLSHNGLHRHN